jgi:hypothetical protein
MNTAWETLIIDFDLLLERNSILNGTISMKWNKEDCIENKQSENPTVIKLEPQGRVSNCFHQQIVTSKIPCSIESNLNQLFTQEMNVEQDLDFLQCLEMNEMSQQPTESDSNDSDSKELVNLKKRQSSEVWSVTTFP